MKIVPIHKHCSRDTISALEHLLFLARAGQLRGVAVCAKRFGGAEDIAITGAYRTNPALAMTASMRMSLHLMRDIEQ